MMIVRAVLRGVGRLLRFIGQVVVAAVTVAALAILCVGMVYANYTATQGSGTSFASVDIAGVKHMANMICDVVIGQPQCAGVAPASTPADVAQPALVATLSPSSVGLITALSNASSGVSTSSVSAPTIAYGYGFNGTTWDQLQVDASKNLKVATAGTQTNATSALATSTANGATVGWLYGFNGTTWDQLQVDASKNLKVAITANSTTVADPCANGTHKYIPISQATSTQLTAAGAAGTVNYICSYQWNAADAENISLVEGTGSVCATDTTAIIGATTAAAGNNFAANSGSAQGTGRATLTAGTKTAHAICLFQSGSGRVAGFINVVQQ